MMAQMLSKFPQRRLLDVGCSTAVLQRLLPADYDYYGCDVADHACQSLDADHFRQIDLNRSCDLSAFAGRGIAVIHVGGVLEYLECPDELVGELRRLVPRGSPLLLSIINFEG